MTDTATATPETIETEQQAPSTLAPGASYSVIFRDDGGLSVIENLYSDATPGEQAAWQSKLVDALRGFASGGVTSMPRSMPTDGRGGGGSVSFHLRKDGDSPTRVRSATPAQLAALRPFVMSRWTARVATWGETRFEEGAKIFDVGDREPAIVRLLPSAGAGLALSCVGRPVKYHLRDDGLRCGGSPDDPEAFDLVGFIDAAAWDTFGVVASLLIVCPWVHDDLVTLEAAGELESVRLCLSHAATATRRKTAWGTQIFDVTCASANSLAFTSLSHALGTRLLRRLTPDEPLSTDDSRPTEHSHVPRGAVTAAAPVDVAEAAAIVPGAVTPTQRSPLLAMTQTFGIPAGGPNSQSFSYGVDLGVIPHITIDTGDANIIAWAINITSTGCTVVVYNYGSLVTRTITGYAW